MLDPSAIMLMRFSLYVLFFTGAFLLIRMLQTRLYNLFGLVMFFILFPTNLLFAIYFDSFLYWIIVNTYYSFLALFVKNTFYREQKSYYLFLLCFIIALRLYEFIIRLLFQFESLSIPPTDPIQLIFFNSVLIAYHLQPILAFLWLAIASLTMYKNLKKIEIKNWIKARYLIIGLSSLIYLFETIDSIYLRITKDYMNPISAYLSILCSI